jgi:hypothetical protein
MLFSAISGPQQMNLPDKEKPNQKEREAALEALRRIQGCVSLGSMNNEIIDEELYGPLCVDDKGNPTLRGMVWRLLESCQKQFSRSELSRIWQNPELGALWQSIEEKCSIQTDASPCSESEWQEFARRGPSERMIVLEKEILGRIPAFFRECYATAYHALNEMSIAVRDRYLISVQMLARQLFDLVTRSVYVRMNLGGAHALIASAVDEHERRFSSQFEVWISHGVLPPDWLKQQPDFLEGDMQILLARIMQQRGMNISDLAVDPSLPTFREYYKSIKKPFSAEIEKFRDINARVRSLDSLDSSMSTTIKQWKRLLNYGFEAYHSDLWHRLSLVAHGLLPSQELWEDLGENEIGLVTEFKDNLEHHALLYFGTCCFVVLENTFREVFRMPEDKRLKRVIDELPTVNPMRSTMSEREGSES